MNKHIVIATIVIGASGVMDAILNNKPLTPVIMGSFVFLLLLSLADAIGGGLSQLASGLAMIAMLYVLLTVFPWNVVLKAIGLPSVHMPLSQATKE